MTGVYGKLPGYGDFVRRGLPLAFVDPWDQWLQAGLGAARDALGSEFAARWAAMPPWRFHLRAGVCGDSAVVGVLLSSHDSVERPFPLTLAALQAADESPPNEAWYEMLERAGEFALTQGESVDALLAQLPSTNAGRSIAIGDIGPAPGWWTRDGAQLSAAALPTPAQFRALLQGGARGERLVARATSHPGTVRKRNEDAFVDRGDIGLWAVADGAGGHGSGDVASAAAAAALVDLPQGLSAAEILAQVRLRLGAVHLELQRLAAETDQGICATTVVVLMARGEHFACLWAGDSRAYLLRDGVLSQITHDHSLVQELVEAGALAPEDAEGHEHANVITRAIGSHEALELDKVSGRIVPGDLLLLCTDGLFKALPESEIANQLVAGNGSAELIELALRSGARDNVTAVVIEV